VLKAVVIQMLRTVVNDYFVIGIQLNGSPQQSKCSVTVAFAHKALNNTTKHYGF